MGNNICITEKDLSEMIFQSAKMILEAENSTIENNNMKPAVENRDNNDGNQSANNNQGEKKPSAFEKFFNGARRTLGTAKQGYHDGVSSFKEPNNSGNVNGIPSNKASSSTMEANNVNSAQMLYKQMLVKHNKDTEKAMEETKTLIQYATVLYNNSIKDNEKLINDSNVFFKQMQQSRQAAGTQLTQTQEPKIDNGTSAKDQLNNLK